MDFQNIHIYLYYILMDTFYEYILGLFRGITHMFHIPVYGYKYDTKKYQQNMEVFGIQKKIKFPTINFTENFKRGGKLFLDALQPEPLSIYSLKIVTGAIIYKDIALKTSIENSEEEPKETFDETNALYDMCSEPKYCYFFVNINPNKHFSNLKISQCTNKSNYHCFNEETEELLDEDYDDTLSENDYSADSTIDKLYDTPQTICHSRSNSECSDDSFICFEEVDDHNDNTAHKQLDNCSFGSEIDCTKLKSCVFGEEDTYTDADTDSDTESDIESDACNQDDNIDSPSSSKTLKKVRFNPKPEIHVMHTWDFAYRSARKGDWQVHSRDRARFLLRIQRTAAILDPVLTNEHRRTVYQERFNVEN